MRCLAQIESLLLNAEKLRKRYGLQSVTQEVIASRDNASILKSNCTKFSEVSKTRSWKRGHRIENGGADARGASILQKTRWAINDGDEFERLIKHLRDFIDGLYQIIPVSKSTQDQRGQFDIASILNPKKLQESMSRLQLVKKACEEARYTAWPDMASITI
jgi:hypothetical protein